MNRVPIEEYKGYQITEHRKTAENLSYYCVYKDNQQLSFIALNSVKAARNVIDTHERVLNDNLKYKDA